MKIGLKKVVLREKLARKNLSQNCFARKIGISSGDMSQLFAGTRNPSPKLREKMMKELKLEEGCFDEIFTIKKL